MLLKSHYWHYLSLEYLASRKLTRLESGNPKAIGFIYKNEAGNSKRDKYINSIDQVERITGYDFFSALPDDIEECIEQIYDLRDWR